jgi:hypothetical protein
MKLLFLGSQPLLADARRKFQELRVWQEITDLQRRAALSGGTSIAINLLPDAKYEELRHLVRHYRPDVLHISAHGETDALSFSDHSGREILVAADMLSSTFDEEFCPKLVFLSACNSQQIGRALAERVPHAVGFSTSISHPDALRVSREFYDSLFNGKSIQESHERGLAALKATPTNATFELFSRLDANPANEWLCPLVLLVAKFEDNTPKWQDHHCEIRMGLRNLPPNSIQVIYFTSSRHWVENEYDPKPRDLCLVSLLDIGQSLQNSTIWSADTWSMHGRNSIWHACAITATGEHAFVRSDIRTALRRHYDAERLNGVIDQEEYKRLQEAIVGFTD